MLRLNFCVRYGNTWIPQAIVTGNSIRFGSALLRLSLARFFSGFSLTFSSLFRAFLLRLSFPELFSQLRFLSLLFPALFRSQAFPHLQNRTGLTLNQISLCFRALTFLRFFCSPSRYLLSSMAGFLRSSPRPISISKLHMLPHFHR